MNRFLCLALMLAACGGSSSDSASSSDAGSGDGSNVPPGQIVPPPPGPAPTDGGGDAQTTAGLDTNRDRLLATYLAFLKSNPTQTQSNGLSGANVSDVCDLWKKLDPSSQATYLTLTHRMNGGVLGDGTTMLAHIAKLYRVVGGQNAKASPPG